MARIAFALLLVASFARAHVPAQAALPAELVKWMKPLDMTPWQGAWNTQLVIRASPEDGPLILGYGKDPGEPMALAITGDRARAYNGRVEYALQLTVTSPCTATFHGVGESNIKQFVIKDGQVRFGDGAVGYRRGKTAIVCSPLWWFGIVTVEADSKCHGHRQEKDNNGNTVWAIKDGITCRWDKDALILTTFASMGSHVGNVEHRLDADGDVLVDKSFARATRARTYDEAKTTARAWYVKHDRGELAKAAGGKVGDPSTVLGLWATFAGDRTRVLGKSFTLTTRVLGAQGTHVGLVDGKSTEKFMVLCVATHRTTPVLSPGDHVRVTGTVAYAFELLWLKECSVARVP